MASLALPYFSAHLPSFSYFWLHTISSTYLLSRWIFPTKINPETENIDLAIIVTAQVNTNNYLRSN